MTDVAQARLLDAVIAGMVASRPWTPDTVVFRCDCLSRVFVRKCRQAGIKAQVARLGPRRGPLPRMHAKWRAMTGNRAEGRCAGHHVVLVGRTVIDFSYLQFDHEASVPHVTTIAETLAEWSGMTMVA
jgi:hypothetical protein